MANSEQYRRNFEDRFARLEAEMAQDLAGDLAEDPRLIDRYGMVLDDQRRTVEEAALKADRPTDSGLSDLIGLHPEAPTKLGEAYVPVGVEVYDETVTSERLIAVGDLYYIYQHEKLGLFAVMQKLKQLFEAGTLKVSSGPGALGLYRFDRRQVLRYTQRDRWAAYRRVFGYGTAPVPPTAIPNADFHRLFKRFIDEVTLYWRDKRVSDVMRERAYDPSFGSMAIVRRAGLDLRNNLKWESYGHVNVMRVEVMQLLDEAFRVLGAKDIREEFGAETAWDVVEDVLTRYFKVHLETSPRQRMAVTGRNVLRWLAQPHVLETGRPQFEAVLSRIAADTEEWLTSAEALGVAYRRPPERALPWDQRRPAVASNGRRVAEHAESAEH